MRLRVKLRRLAEKSETLILDGQTNKDLKKGEILEVNGISYVIEKIKKEKERETK